VSINILPVTLAGSHDFGLGLYGHFTSEACDQKILSGVYTNFISNTAVLAAYF